MKTIPIATVTATSLLAVLPASAQNAGPIARARGGTSCPGWNLLLAGLEARGLKLAGARLRQADLSLVVMNRTRFSNADLDGVAFSGSTLRGASFGGASLRRATGLAQGRLNQACGDEATHLPCGLSIPRCQEASDLTAI